MSYAAASTEAYFRTAAAQLAVRPGPADHDLPAALLQRHYGLSGSITLLSSEAERTFEVNLGDGRRLILKTSARPEAAASFQFQTAALAGVHKTVGFVTPKVLRTRDGALMFEQEGVRGYLQTRLDGIPLYKARRCCVTHA